MQGREEGGQADQQKTGERRSRETDLDVPSNPWPGVVAMVLYAVATALSLFFMRSMRMPVGIAAGNVAVAGASLILVLPQLDPADENGYATWIIGAIGTLMTITVVRQRALFALGGDRR